MIPSARAPPTQTARTTATTANLNFIFQLLGDPTFTKSLRSGYGAAALIATPAG
jgi:hypothetical protein